MFTKDQLRQMQELLEPLKQGQKRLGNQIEELKVGQEQLSNDVSELKSDVSGLKTGQEILRIEGQSTVKVLKDLKKKVTYISKTVDIIGRRYDERIVENTRRIDVIEGVVGIVPQKH